MDIRKKIISVVMLLLPMALGARENGWQGYPAWLGTAAIYHIYPSSFQDSDGNGIGDLEGREVR